MSKPYFEHLSSGSQITFSAGSQALDPKKFRVLKLGYDRLGNILKRFPELIEYFGNGIPLIINCYPAAVGNFPNAIFIDTYLRWQNFVRALLLSYDMDSTAVIIGQPLPVLNLMIRYKKLGYPLPSRILFGLGGYICPLSLEMTLLEIIHEAKAKGRILHAYGMAEVEFSCLVGLRQKNDKDIIYYSIIDHIKPLVRAGKLLLKSHLPEYELEVDTGDFGQIMGDGAIIHNPPTRLNPILFSLIENWGTELWYRRTGYIDKRNKQFIYQLREGEKIKHDDELPFHDFNKCYSSSWLDKPNWSLT